MLAALKKADLHAVEWSENWHIPAGDAALARDLRERTLAQGAEIAAYGSYYRLGQNSDPAKDFFLPTLQSAAALGAPLIRIWGWRHSIVRAGCRYTQGVGDRGKDRQ